MIRADSRGIPAGRAKHSAGGTARNSCGGPYGVWGGAARTAEPPELEAREQLARPPLELPAARLENTVGAR